ncbi:30309_t:CDS:2, partial [Gigaspora margarita]
DDDETEDLKQKKKLSIIWVLSNYNELDSDSENSRIDYTEKFDEVEHNELMTSNTIGQGVFDYDPSE